MPLLLACYVIAYLDRVNVGFAKLQMLNALHFSDAVYGMGAGLFFIGYFIFEVPSNLLLHRFGARRWIARIMISWALLSMGMALISSPAMFYVMRFALGIAEAGFFPGMILYLTQWFPARRRGRMVALLMAGNPLSGLLGGPLSGTIMHSLSGTGGLAGWQWLFIIEGLPAVLLGVAVFFYLDDRIESAAWLDGAEKDIMRRELAEDAALHTLGSVRASFTSVRVWLLCLILFSIIMGSYTIGFWQPTIIRNSGVADPLQVGLLTMIPYAVALVCMLWTSRHADHTHERRWHVSAPALLGAAGYCICALNVDRLLPSMFGLTLAAAGVISALPMFWALPTAFLGGRGAAAGIAWINSIGNLAGFVSPALIGWLATHTHSLASGLWLVAGSLSVAAVLIVGLIPARLVNR
jgi:MFS family permease